MRGKHDIDAAARECTATSAPATLVVARMRLELRRVHSDNPVHLAVQ